MYWYKILLIIILLILIICLYMKNKEHYSQRVYLLNDNKIDFNEFASILI